jgi:hypothetical protein
MPAPLVRCPRGMPAEAVTGDISNTAWPACLPWDLVARNYQTGIVSTGGISERRYLPTRPLLKTHTPAMWASHHSEASAAQHSTRTRMLGAMSLRSCSSLIMRRLVCRATNCVTVRLRMSLGMSYRAKKSCGTSLAA